MTHIERARELRRLIEQASAGLDDQAASMGAELYPTLKGDGSLISAGTRINWRGVVKKAAADLWDYPQNNPDNAPTLWADLDYVDGIRIIPDVITVTTAFSKGEQGWWQDSVYESLTDANVYTPDTYAAGWRWIR